MEFMGSRFLLILFAVIPMAFAAPAPQTQVRLLLSHEAAKPGETITAALEIKSAPKWHTYWRNAGDSGYATTIQWELPQGIQAGAIEWPVPHKLTLAEFGAYAYEGTEYLLIPITIGADAKSARVDF